jgi:hypothetical protein
VLIFFFFLSHCFFHCFWTCISATILIQLSFSYQKDIIYNEIFTIFVQNQCPNLYKLSISYLVARGSDKWLIDWLFVWFYQKQETKSNYQHSSSQHTDYVFWSMSFIRIGVQFNNKKFSRYDIAEIVLKLALNTNQSINQSITYQNL